MSPINNLLSFYLTEPNHGVFYQNTTAGYFMNKVPRIAPTRIGAQADLRILCLSPCNHCIFEQGFQVFGFCGTR